MIIPVQFITNSWFATWLSPKFSATGTDWTVYINEWVMTEVSPWNYIYNFTTYNPAKYYFYKFDADDTSVINRYQWWNNQLDYFKQTQWYWTSHWWWTVRIDYRGIGDTVMNRIKEEWMNKDYTSTFELIEAKINLLNNELNRKLSEPKDEKQNRLTQKKIEGLYAKLDEIRPSISEVKDNLDNKIGDLKKLIIDQLKKEKAKKGIKKAKKDELSNVIEQLLNQESELDRIIKDLLNNKD